MPLVHSSSIGDLGIELPIFCIENQGGYHYTTNPQMDTYSTCPAHPSTMGSTVPYDNALHAAVGEDWGHVMADACSVTCPPFKRCFQMKL